MTASGRDRWIQVDGEVLAAIGELAEPFSDSPNDVVRRLLDLPRGERRLAIAPRATTPGAGRGSGEFLREADYELPILKVLAGRGGTASRPEVMEGIEAHLGPRISEADREPLQNGEERWRNRASFCRRRLVAAGLLRSETRRGIWELSRQGEQHLRRLESEAEHDRPEEPSARPVKAGRASNPNERSDVHERCRRR